MCFNKALGFDYGTMIITGSPHNANQNWPLGQNLYGVLSNDVSGDAPSDQDILNVKASYYDDGVLNENDLCPNTPAGSKVNAQGCRFFELPSENFVLKVTSATCIGLLDGSFDISVCPFNVNVPDISFKEYILPSVAVAKTTAPASATSVKLCPDGNVTIAEPTVVLPSY